jgi:hypothetical protein
LFVFVDEPSGHYQLNQLLGTAPPPAVDDVNSDICDCGDDMFLTELSKTFLFFSINILTSGFRMIDVLFNQMMVNIC